MAYDSENNRTILFGGYDTSYHNDTWIYNYTILNTSCGNMNQGYTCQLNWTVNTTGNIGTYWEIDFNFTSDNSSITSNNTSDAYVKITETTPPTFTNNNSNTSSINQGEPVLLYANWSDNNDLDYAWLSTNETSSWVNYTGGTYGSPIDINLSVGETWSNFTWDNNTFSGVVAWRIYANDSSGNENVTGEMTITVSVDTSAPNWYNNATNVTSGSAYSYGQAYQFNVTWNDSESDVDTVLIEHNFTGGGPPSSNYSVSNESDVYYYDVNGLAAGTYAWKMYANNTYGYENVTNGGSYWIYTVGQAATNVTAWLNSSALEQTVEYGNGLNFTGTINTSYSVTLNFSVNDSALGDNFYSASSPAENTSYSTTDFTDWAAPNTTYNFTVYFAGDTNYTSGSEILYFHVHDTTTPTYSNNQTNTTVAGQPANFTLDWTDTGGLAGYIFSTNNSGTWENASYVSFSGSSNTSWNVTTLNSTAGTLVAWCVYANDTSGNMNDTSCQSGNEFLLTTTAAAVCGDITSDTTLTNNVSADATCFNILANDITLDCAGYWINYSKVSVGYGVNITGYDNTTIKNCNIYQGGPTIADAHAIYFSNSKYGNVTNNSINITLTSGNAGTGIYLISSSNNNTVSDNTINTAGTNNGWGISLSSSSNNSISDNTITTDGTVGFGINIISSSNNNTVSDNNITTNIYGSNGIRTFSSNSNTLSNNTITAVDDSVGISLESSSNNVLSNNSMTTPTRESLAVDGTTISHFNHTIDELNLAHGKPIKYYFNVSDTIVEDNDTYGQLYVATSDNVTISNITITNADSIVFVYTNNSKIENCNISGATVWGAIYLRLYSSSNNITNNIVDTTNDAGYGIYLRSSNNTVSNNNITTDGSMSYGIWLRDSNNNTITNNNITTNGYGARGILFGSAGSSSNSNTVTNNKIITYGSSAHGIEFEDSVNNRIIDTEINTTINANDIYIEGTNSYTNYIINSTFNQSDIGFASGATDKIEVQWYLDVFVNDTLSNPLYQANVTSWMSNSTEAFTKLTNSSGYIERQTLTEYSHNSSQLYPDNVTYLTNYTVNATKYGFIENTTEVNLTESMTTYLTLEDQEAPQYFNNSTNNTVANLPTLFSLNWTDKVELSGYIFSTNNTGIWANDSWIEMTGATNWSNATTTLNETVGVRVEWCVYANDTSGNMNGTSCVTPFFLITTDTTPTYSNNQTNTTAAGQPANFTLDWTDNLNLAGYIFSTNNTGTWDNASYVSFSGSSNTSWNVTTLNSTIGTLVAWCVYANDTSGNMNDTSCQSGNEFLLTTTDEANITNCTVLDVAGVTYYLINDIPNSDYTTCMNITANNVTLDCQGYLIDGDDSGSYGIYARRASATDTNITVKNCNVTDWNYGIYIYYSNLNNLTNNTVSSNQQVGLNIIFSSNNQISDSKYFDNLASDVGLSAAADNQCNNELTNVNGTEDKPIVYYNSSVTIQDWYNNASEIILCNADNSIIDNLTMDRTGVENNGIVLRRVDYINVSNVNVTDLEWGIQLSSNSNNNNITNVTSYSNVYGILLSGQANNNNIINLTSYSNSYGVWIYNSYNNTLNESSVYDNSDDYLVQAIDSTTNFTDTNFTAARTIRFGDATSWFNYNNETTGNIWLKTNLSAAATITRELTTWSQSLMQWNDTNTSGSGITARYNITGLNANWNYHIYNNSVSTYNLTTDADGNLPTFTIDLKGEHEIKVEKVNVSFAVTLPNDSVTYSSISGASTLDEEFNSTTQNDKNVTVCIRGTSDCQNSTIIGDLTNVSNFRVNNTGNVNENITMCINESLSSKIVLFGTKTADPYDASLYVIPNCSDSVWIANSSLALNAMDEFWIWTNFTGVSVDDATERKLYINATESGT